MKRLNLHLSRLYKVTGLVTLFTLLFAACSPAPIAQPTIENQNTPQANGVLPSTTTGMPGIPVTGGSVMAADNQKFGKILVNSEFGGIWHVAVVNGS